MPGANDPISQHASASPMPPGVTDPSYQPLPGRLGNLTVPQQHALDKFRQQLQEKGMFVPQRMDDATLLRFLRARQFDLAKTMTMFESCEKWRKEEKVDELYQNFPALYEKEKANGKDLKLYPQYYHKTDIEGRPVYIEQLGNLNVNALPTGDDAEATMRQQTQRLIYEYEKLLEVRFPICSAAVGHPVETCTTILDLKGVSLLSFSKVQKFASSAASIGQNMYPETMGKFYIINAPWGFSTVWNIAKYWLDPVTVAKIAIFNAVGEQVAALKKQIPEENLPREFGGTCECNGGCAFSDAGPWNKAVANAT